MIKFAFQCLGALQKSSGLHMYLCNPSGYAADEYMHESKANFQDLLGKY